jgi:hypothetical protein
LTPPTNLTIKHITIGHGIQNFTCASSNATPVAIGALANLYDVTTLAFTNETEIAEIPPIAAYLPLDLASNANLTIPGFGTFPRIGHHFFTSAGVPTFAFPTINELLSGKTLASINAPAGSNPGPAGTGATTWLDLGDKGGSMGLSGVYRVLTAGGLPYKTCQGQNSTISVPYSASYWFVALTNTSSPLATGTASPSATTSPIAPTSNAPRFNVANCFVVALVSVGLGVWLM